MTEEQFWRSNPRIIKVYEQTWKDDQNRKNELLHAMVGTYGISAITVALSSVLSPMFCNGRKSGAKYLEKPIRIFPLTEEEQAVEREKAIQAFLMFAGNLEEKVKKDNE